MGVGGENLSCAVDHVIRWATTVMTAVEKIQWRPLGTIATSSIIVILYFILLFSILAISFCVMMNT